MLSNRARNALTLLGCRSHSNSFLRTAQSCKAPMLIKTPLRVPNSLRNAVRETAIYIASILDLSFVPLSICIFFPATGLNRLASASVFSVTIGATLATRCIPSQYLPSWPALRLQAMLKLEMRALMRAQTHITPAVPSLTRTVPHALPTTPLASVTTRSMVRARLSRPPPV